MAILVFNRNRDMTRVLGDVRAVTATHPQFKRALPWPADTEFRCTLLHPNGPDRELTLTALVFDVPVEVPLASE